MDEHLQPLMAKLAPLYRAGRTWTYEESCHLLCLARVPTHMEEIDAVIAYHASLKPHERRFFPHSMLRLLQTWSETLDRIAVAKQLAGVPEQLSTAQKILMRDELKRVEAAIKVYKDYIEGGYTLNDTEKSDRAKLKARRAELLSSLGFSV